MLWLTGPTAKAGFLSITMPIEYSPLADCLLCKIGEVNVLQCCKMALEDLVDQMGKEKKSIWEMATNRVLG